MASIKLKAMAIRAGREVEIVKACMKSAFKKGDKTKLAHVTGKTRCKKTGQDTSYHFQFAGCDLEYFINLKVPNCREPNCLIFKLNQGYDWIKVRIL